MRFVVLTVSKVKEVSVLVVLVRKVKKIDDLAVECRVLVEITLEVPVCVVTLELIPRTVLVDG